MGRVVNVANNSSKDIVKLRKSQKQNLPDTFAELSRMAVLRGMDKPNKMVPTKAQLERATRITKLLINRPAPPQPRAQDLLNKKPESTVRAKIPFEE